MSKISVCIPTYNRADLFRETLRSVLRQSFADFEIIVSDNASEEDILGVITEAADTRIRFYRQQRNLGALANGLFLQTLAQGEYIIWLCSDDLLLPDCLEKAAHTLDINPVRGGVVYMAAHYGAKGFDYLSTMPPLEYADADVYRKTREVRDFRFASPSLCMYRRAALESIGGWDTELLAAGDWEMYARMIRKGGGICYLHEVLAIMRLHDNRHSNTTALYWDFYHDILILSSRPEHRWGVLYEARAVMEQLLWDLRLRRSPGATLRHAWRYGALKSFLVLFPYEIARRLLIKVAVFVGGRRGREDGMCVDSSSVERFNREVFDAFWRDMTRDSVASDRVICRK